MSFDVWSLSRTILGGSGSCGEKLQKVWSRHPKNLRITRVTDLKLLNCPSRVSPYHPCHPKEAYEVKIILERNREKKQMAFWRTAAAFHGCRKIARFSSRAATKKVKPNKENMSSKQPLLVGHTSLKNSHQTQPKNWLAFRVQYKGQPPKRPLPVPCLHREALLGTCQFFEFGLRNSGCF